MRLSPIALAVMLAEQHGDKSQQRRALSIQGLILTATRNTPDALRSLMQALDIAEEFGGQQRIAASWVNISVTFLEATLYTDARVCYQRADEMASAIEDAGQSSYLRWRALHGVALCGLYLHEYLQGSTPVKRR